MNALSPIITLERPVAGQPVRYANLAGIFTPAHPLGEPSDGVLVLVSPWGFEDMAIRPFYRETADAASRLGVPSLRFDLPGTGDSAETADDATLDTWLAAIQASAEEAARLSGASRVILAGHGLGATLALLAEARIANVAGIALLAPVTSGRMYARETALWWKMIAADLGLGSAFTDTGALTIAGMTMPDTIAAAIRKIRDTDLKLSRPLDILAVSRPAREADEALAASLEAAGAHVSRLPYDGFDALVVNPLISRVPETIVRDVARWARAVAPKFGPSVAAGPQADNALIGEGYRETGLRFADDGRLAGTFCEPIGEVRGAPVLLVSTSYDRASAWGNTGSRMARDLARRGIASLRFDAAGVADSPAQPDDPEQILYGESLDRDVAAALDELVRLTGRSAVLAGRCSGGYHAFQAALDRADVAGVAVINSYAFVWDPAKRVDDALATVARPLGDYSKRAMNPETFRRILRGEVNLKAAGLAILSQIGRRLYNKVEPLLGNLSAGNRLKSKIHEAFQALEARNVSVVLAYGDNDPGLEQSRLVFGSDLAGVRRYGNVRFASLGDSDHNVTVPEAQETVIEEIARLALKA